jgi:hypothetical protein
MRCRNADMRQRPLGGVLEGHSPSSFVYLSDFREDCVKRISIPPPTYNILGGLLPKLLKRLMLEIQKIAIVPNVPRTE